MTKETISELHSDNLGKKYLLALENQPEQTFKDTARCDTYLFDKQVLSKRFDTFTTDKRKVCPPKFDTGKNGCQKS